MIDAHEPAAATILLVGLFAVLYLGYLLRKTVAGGMDLYDLMILSTVALVPALFVFFPGISRAVSALTGVAFPFVVMFGVLFFVLFITVHRLTVKLHKLETTNRLLVQELSLLQHNVQRIERR
jgi:hypothetical protein